MITPRRYGWLVASALSCAGLATACSDSDEDSGGRPGDAAADAATGDGEEMGSVLADQAQAQLGHEPAPAAIAYLGAIVLAIDGCELSQAEIAIDRANDPVVMDYADRMSDEHADHSDTLEALLADRGVSPTESAVSGSLRAEAFAGIRELKGTPRSELDFVYMRLKVKMHAAAGVLVNRLCDLAPDDAALLGFLDATRDAIAAHRTQAEAILRAR
jgi:predicted outer membrane protein